MREKADKWILAFYLIAFVIIASTLALYQPLGENALQLNPPDEHARFLVPYYICRHGTLPTGFEEEVRIPSYGFSYALYNAFPYIVQGLVMRLVSFFDDSLQVLLYAGRFVNVASGTVMAIVVWLLSRKLFRERGLRWMFCFGVTFLPQNLFMHTYVNTDSICLLSTALMVLALVDMYQKGVGCGNSLLLSCGIVLCALSYYNAYGYILSSVFLFLALFIREKTAPGGSAAKRSYVLDWKGMLQKGIPIAVLVLLGAGWWFVRSFFLYDGDFLGLRTREDMAIRYAVPAVNPLATFSLKDSGVSLWKMIFGNQYIKLAFYSFVATYGAMILQANVWIYRIFALFYILGIGAAVLLKEPKEDFLGRAAGWKKRFFHINMVFCILMPPLLMVHYAYTMDYQYQGRYLLPALVPFMYYVVRGWEKIMADRHFLQKTGIRRAIVLGTAALTLGSCIYMTYAVALPKYLENGLSLEEFFLSYPNLG